MDKLSHVRARKNGLFCVVTNFTSVPVLNILSTGDRLSRTCSVTANREIEPDKHERFVLFAVEQISFIYRALGRLFRFFADAMSVANYPISQSNRMRVIPERSF